MLHTPRSTGEPHRLGNENVVRYPTAGSGVPAGGIPKPGATGDAPKRHDSVIQQFGLLARDLDEAMRAAGRAFNAAKDDRNAADYDEAAHSSPEDARESLRSAHDFLTVRDERHGFGLSQLGNC